MGTGDKSLKSKFAQLEKMKKLAAVKRTASTAVPMSITAPPRPPVSTKPSTGEGKSMSVPMLVTKSMIVPMLHTAPAAPALGGEGDGVCAICEYRSMRPILFVVVFADEIDYCETVQER